MSMTTVWITVTTFLLSARRGSAAVEFAILAPLFIFLFMGLFGYGVYFGASHSVQQLAADAARSSIAGLDEEDRRVLASGFIERNASGYMFIDPELLLVEVHGSNSDVTQFEVRVSYDASQLPIWGLFGGVAMPDQTIVRRSTIRIGGL